MQSKSLNLKSPSAPLYIFGSLLIVAVLGFIGGMQYQKGHNSKAVINSSTTSASANSGQGFGGGGFGRRFGGVRPTFGQVTSISPSSISVQDARTGSAVTFSITSSTSITNGGQSATTADIQTGTNVAVIANSSDSSQASRILVNPTFGGGSNSSNSSNNSGSASL